LAFPSRPQRFDDLDERDATGPRISLLLEDVLSEIGSPMDQYDNMERYAVQLYRRLLLQWPRNLMALPMNDAITLLSDALHEAFPGGYRDSVTNRRAVLATCVSCFPFIRPSFYDCWHSRDVADVAGWAGEPWSIEETPFILPPPWRNATSTDIEQGSLLLRDPSNAWRFPFWRRVFRTQCMDVLHLVRDPRESVQGLCDGWNYPFGFQTMPSDEPLVIPGYTDFGFYEFKQHRLNFSISRWLDRRLSVERGKLTLVGICAHQWKEANQSIVSEAARLGLRRAIVDLGDLRTNALEVFRTVCAIFGLECSPSGAAYAESFPSRLFMATMIGRRAGHDRWQRSAYSEEIRRITSSGYFDDVSLQLGLGRVSLSNEGDPHHLDARRVGQERRGLRDITRGDMPDTDTAHA
jgi:hypothetical protein